MGEMGVDLANASRQYVLKCSVCHGEDGAPVLASAPDLQTSTLSVEERVAIIAYGKGTGPLTATCWTWPPYAVSPCTSRNSGTGDRPMAKNANPSPRPSSAETCVLIGLATRHQRREQLEEYLEELAFLAETAKAERQRTFIQSLDKPDVRTFVGSGKLQEIKEYVEEEDIDIIIFDDELSPIQLRNIEKEIPERKVLDRTNLILDIFAQRPQPPMRKLCGTSPSTSTCCLASPTCGPTFRSRREASA